MSETTEWRKQWSHKPTPIPADAQVGQLWYSEQCVDQMLAEYSAERIASLQQQLSASVPLEKYEEDMGEKEAEIERLTTVGRSLQRDLNESHKLFAEAERTIETAVELLRTTRKWMTHKPCDNPKCVTCAAMRGVDAFIAARAALSAEAQKEKK